MQYTLRNENREGDYYTRDSAAIAYACRDINKQYFDPAFWAAMDGLGYQFSSVVDLGCGSGQRLMQILDRYPGTKAIGLDLAGPALKVAEAEAKGRGYSHRLTFVGGDAREIEKWLAIVVFFRLSVMFEVLQLVYQLRLEIYHDGD